MMIDSSKWSVIEAGLKCVQGQVDRQLDQPERGRGGVPPPGPAGPPLRCRGGGDGVRRTGTGRHPGSQDRDLPAGLQTAHRAGGLPCPRISSSTSTSSRSAPGSRNTITTPSNSSTAVRELKRLLPDCKTSGGVSNVSFSYRGNDVVREAMNAAFLYHAIRGRARHGNRQRGPARSLRGDSQRPSRARRGRALEPPAGCRRSAHRVRRVGQVVEEQGQGQRPRLARRTRGRTPQARADHGHPRLHRRRHRGSASRPTTGRCRSSKVRSWTA